MSDDDDDKKQSDLEKRLEALEAKNTELLGEVKEERRKRREAEAAAETAAKDAEDKAAEAAEKAGDIETLKKQWETAKAKEIEKITKERDDALSNLHKLLIDGGIDAALDAAGMSPSYKRMLRRDFAAENEITIRDGQAYVGDVALSDAVKKWTEDESVSGLKAAGHGSGSGAPGGGKSAGGKLADMTEADRLKLARENPDRLRQLRTAG